MRAFVRAGTFVLALTSAAMSVATVKAQPAGANPFVYRPGYQRLNRYVYRNHAWLRVGFYSASAPGFYPSVGYLGFVPPPLYAVPIYPAYAYPAPYYYPAVPYAFGRPAVPIFYGPPMAYGMPYAVPYGAPLGYGYAYRRVGGTLYATRRPYARAYGGYATRR